jgi:mandelamide amidase
MSRRTLIQSAAALAVPLTLPACGGNGIEQLNPSQQLALTATGAVAAIKSGSLTAEAYVSTLLARAKLLSGLNTVITLNETGALAAAKAIDAKRLSGQALPALAGLPILVKDNINTQDLPTSGGTPALKAFRPKANAPVLQALLDAGAIVLAKTNMHELAFGITSSNAATAFVKILTTRPASPVAPQAAPQQALRPASRQRAWAPTRGALPVCLPPCAVRWGCDPR